MRFKNKVINRGSETPKKITVPGTARKPANLRSMVENISKNSGVPKLQNFPKTVNIELTERKPKLSFLKKYSDANATKQGGSVSISATKNSTGRVTIPGIKID